MVKKEEKEQQKLEISNGLLPITSDYVFKRVFAYEGNEDVLKDLLEAILKIDIKSLKVRNPEILGQTKESKKIILDIKVKLEDGTKVDVEMQAKNEGNIEERGTTYIGELIAEELNSGEVYRNLNKVIFIGILNFNYYKRNSYHNIARFKFEETNKEEYVNMGYTKEDREASRYMEMHFIELPKFKKKNPNMDSKLNQWLWLFSGEGEKMKMAEKKNKKVEKAMKTLEKLSMDPKEREIQRSIYLGEFFQRIRETKAEERGKQEGEKEKSIEIAKNMLKRNFTLEEVIDITGLTKKEIEKLK